MPYPLSISIFVFLAAKKQRISIAIGAKIKNELPFKNRLRK